MDGPIRIATDGGYAQIAGPAFGAQPAVGFTGIQASAAGGTAADAARPSANAGQAITLVGQGFTSSTLVQFAATDDTGATGTLTRTGTVGNNGTTLTVTVPALAKTGSVRILGTDQSHMLQVVPVLRAIGGTVAAGNVIELEGTGLNPAELQVQIDGIGVGGFAVKTVAEGSSGATGQQILTLTVPTGIGAGQVTLTTRGGGAAIRTGVSTTPQAGFSPTGDAGDTLATATAVALPANSLVTIASSTGDNGQAGLDVDLYAVTLAAGDQLTFATGGTSQYSYLRIFNAAGTALAAQYLSPNTSGQFTAPAAGTYHVGVSGYYNTSYDPTKANSGANGGYLGAYQLMLTRRGADSTALTAITATATQGTPAQGKVASANIGQTITLAGAGLTTADRILFTVDNGGSLSATTATPASVAADGRSLTVVVPTGAATGMVRLAREQAGLLLQIVPTLTAVAVPAGGTYAGQQMTLTGTGFSPVTGSIRFGNDAPVTSNANYYNSGTQAYVTVPTGAAAGPITLTTIGGTSNTLARTFTGIEASAASGTAADGTKAAANPGQTITLTGTGLTTGTPVLFQTIDEQGNRSETVLLPGIVAADGTSLQVAVPTSAVSGTTRIVGDTTGAAIALQIVPVVTGVSNVSVNGDGTATVTLTGLGFVEGNDTRYAFGTRIVRDPGTTTGPDVTYGYRNGSYVQNGSVNVVVPLGAVSAGAITVTTGGGTSVAHAAGITGVTGVALSGTPADAARASANPGQTVTLTGTDLTTTTDIVLTYMGSNGTTQWVALNPATVAVDGKSATLLVPAYANGAYILQMFGAPAAPLLQIVPTVASMSDNGNNVTLAGRGFVEGASRYSIGGVIVADTGVSTGPDVYGGTVGSIYADNSGVNLGNLAHGFGTVTVTTAGGTSAALVIDSANPNVGGLGSVAYDITSNALWVGTLTNPSSLIQIDASSGATLKTIALPSSVFGATSGYYEDLQVAPIAFTLGSTAIAKGSLLLFEGYGSTDRVIAVDASTGGVLGSLTLGTNHDLRGGVYDPVLDHFFVAASSTGKIVEINAQTGASIASFSPPTGFTAASLAIDPSTGNLWYGSDNSRTIALLDRKGTLVKQIDLTANLMNASLTGLAFDANGKLLVSTSAGTVVRV